MEAALQEYRALLTPEETKPFESLTRELSAYWDVLEPVFAWTPEQRRRDGYVFLRDQVFPRRVSMLGIADQIGAIAESDLDQGRRRAEATFSRFRARLAVTVGLTLGLGLLLAAFSIRQILGLEKEAEARYQEIASARAELEHLSGRLVQVQEDERRSLSRDLHDEVGQALTGVLLEMANLSTLIRTRDLEALAAKTDEIKKLLEGAIGVVRNMALLLRPSMLDDLGLLPALQWQAREVSRRTGLRVQVAAEGVAEDLPEEVRTCVYRVVQEALHNCVRHAAAQTVRVTLSTEGGALGLSIHDDGRGFDSLRSRGLGLVGLEERVRRLGGTFSVDSKPGRGTVLLVSLPLSPVPGPPGL
jgi:signal transduction histidine kinase